MKKLILAGAVLFQITCYLQAQEIKHPKGVYKSFEEIANKAPSRQMDLQVIKRSTGDIKMVSENDYKLDTDDKSIKKGVLRKEILAYSTGCTPDLNCLPYKVQPQYAKVISLNPGYRQPERVQGTDVVSCHFWRQWNFLTRHEGEANNNKEEV